MTPREIAERMRVEGIIPPGEVPEVAALIAEGMKPLLELIEDLDPCAPCRYGEIPEPEDDGEIKCGRPVGRCRLKAEQVWILAAHRGEKGEGEG